MTKEIVPEIPEDSIAKKILDKYATIVTPQDAIWENNEGQSIPNQIKNYNYCERGYTGKEVLWYAPKDSLVIEFEDSPENNKKYIEELEAAARAKGYDYCVTGHNGKSDYFRMFNIKGIEVNDDNLLAKEILCESLLSKDAYIKLDKSNLRWTLSPIIEHPHWKRKYNGNIHKILRGKNPIEHKNEYPKELSIILKKTKKLVEDCISDINENAPWVEKFLLEYCCSNLLPAGNRHLVIEKNLASFIISRPDKDLIKQKYYAAQQRKFDSMRTWEKAILSGEYTKTTAGELAKYIKENNIPFELPKIINQNIITNINDNIVSFFTSKHDLAEKLYKLQPYFYDSSRNFWFWNKCKFCYEHVDNTDLLNFAKNNSTADTISGKEKDEIIEGLKQMGRMNIPKQPKKSWIQFHNKIYDLQTDEIILATPEYFITNPLPWKQGTFDQIPTIDKLFGEWVGADRILTLKEIAAFCAISSMPLHRIFCFIGKGRNGKGTFIKFLQKLLGHHNCTATELNKLLNSRFEIIKLYKKLLCTIGEIDKAVFKQTAILKALSGEDTLSSEYKGKDSTEFINYAKPIILTNELPETTDKTDGFYSRWCVVDFPNQFEEGPNPVNLIPDYEFENFCLQIPTLIKNLIERRRFWQEGSIEDRKANYDKHSNPLEKFIKTFCEKNIDSFISFNELYEKYLDYQIKEGYRKCSNIEFGKLLTLAKYEKKVKTWTDINNNSRNEMVVFNLKWQF